MTLGMENCANAFDQPIESREHQDLRTTAWMGGELVSVRYWLGCLLRRNLFREPDDVVENRLREYLVTIGCEKGSRLVSDFQSWRPLATLLQHQVECSEGAQLTRNQRLVAAIQAVLEDPEINDLQLAAIASTTVKQLARMTDVFVLRKCWKLVSD